MTTRKKIAYSAHELEEMTKIQFVTLYNRLSVMGDFKADKYFKNLIIRIISCLGYKRNHAISKIEDTPICIGHIPLVPAVNIDFLDINDQMTIAGGKNFVDQNSIQENTGCFEGIYAWWVIDVEDGSNFSDEPISPKDQARLITGKGRLPLLTPEIIALSLHTDVSISRSICACESACFNEGNVPFVFKGIKGTKPRLDCGNPSNYFANCGSPSCRMRV